MTRTLILGYGNTLRGDDGVGPRFAEAVADWQLADVCSRSVHGLVPELAEMLVHFERVLFADAAANIDRIEVVTLSAKTTASAGHGSDPEALLGLAHWLCGRCPAAWLLKLPATNFDLGEELSACARTGLALALLWTQGWLREENPL